MGVPGLLRWDVIAAHQADWHDRVRTWPLASAAAYVLAYTLVAGASLPAGGLLTLTGGLLFGAVAGAALAVIGASLGATLLFLLARGTLGRWLASRAGPWLDRLGPPLRRDGFWGLLSLRLLPVVPFWLGNLLPALVGMRLAPFAAATLLGIIPATSVLAWLGSGLGRVLAAGRRPDLSLLTSPAVLAPLLGLAALSLLPVLFRRRSADGPV
jgi:uncharacterized membrane protein YdjX (TVP38/TMEM64 family)